ncbi:MAG: DinB family protein [Acidimicrobiia bacterium]
MTEPEPKADLHRYLQVARDALLWKLEGLSEYDVRRPLTPTGTNLLGLVKHAASIELGYFGETFGRPSGEPQTWFEAGAEPNADLWATAGESPARIVGLYHRAWAHADATIEALGLDATGRVPWFGGPGSPAGLSPAGTARNLPGSGFGAPMRVATLDRPPPGRRGPGGPGRRGPHPSSPKRPTAPPKPSRPRSTRC